MTGEGVCLCLLRKPSGFSPRAFAVGEAQKFLAKALRCVSVGLASGLLLNWYKLPLTGYDGAVWAGPRAPARRPPYPLAPLTCNTDTQGINTTQKGVYAPRAEKWCLHVLDTCLTRFRFQAWACDMAKSVRLNLSIPVVLDSVLAELAQVSGSTKAAVATEQLRRSIPWMRAEAGRFGRPRLAVLRGRDGSVTFDSAGAVSAGAKGGGLVRDKVKAELMAWNENVERERLAKKKGG